MNFFEIRPHPRIFFALERYAVAVYSRRAALVYEKHSCLVNCMYLYVLVRTFQGILYWHVPVCIGVYWYVPVHMILPDPIQVYRIPDFFFSGGSCGAGGAQAAAACGSSGSAPSGSGRAGSRSTSVASGYMLGCAQCPVLQTSRGVRVIAETSYAVERIPVPEEQTNQQCQ